MKIPELYTHYQPILRPSPQETLRVFYTDTPCIRFIVPFSAA